MSGENKVGSIEKEKRIYQISLLLRKKSVRYICEYMIQNWHISKAQANRYISLARKEWKRYFEKLQSDGMSYHVAQMRDLKDSAFEADDLRLMFDIAKEEAKLMGIYPSEKHDVNVKGEHHIIVDLPEEENGDN